MFATFVALFVFATVSGHVYGDDVSDLHRAGVSFYERGEFRRALEKFEAALKLAPEEKTIRVNLGRSYVGLASQILDAASGSDSRELENASQLLQKALLHWEGDAQTHELIALCALRRNRLPEAERALRTAVERDPTAVRSWKLLGVVRDQRGKTAAAIEALEKAASLRPGDGAVTRRLRRLRHDQETISGGRPLGSARFRVYVPAELSLDEGRRVLGKLDAICEELERRWGGDPPRGVEVILYPPGEFSRRTGFAEEVGGAFDGRIRIAFPEELKAGGLTLDQVIRHETAHLLLHRLPAPLPKWLDEGLAQMVDGGARADWDERFRESGGSSAEVGILARESAIQAPRPETWAGLYLHSYLFLKDLETQHGRFRLDLVVRRISRGTQAAAAFTEVYGSSPVELDRAWRARLRGVKQAEGEGAEQAPTGAGIKKDGSGSR